MKVICYIIQGLTFSLILSCSPPKEDRDSIAQADSTLSKVATSVQTALAIRKTFVAQTITNGKVLASQEIPLSFQGQGIIENIRIQNGATVKPGQLLATLQNEVQELALREAQLQLDESRVEINDQLITQGGKRGDTASVSREVFAYIKLRSGYNRAMLAVQKARLELDRTFLYAPVAGTVANLTLSAYSPTPSDKPFCTLLNRSNMLVRCPILETELGTVQPGQIARVEPVGIFGATYMARVTDINPIVNAQGLVEVSVSILQPDARLLPGMNVRVLIEKSFSDKLTVSKDAVVERSARKVVFTFKEGLAKWHYVTTGQENDREIVITEGLEAGEEVIIKGNLNLGHDAKVEKDDGGAKN